MEPQNALENATHAMKLAEDWLGVPMVSVHVCVCVCCVYNGPHLIIHVWLNLYIWLVVCYCITVCVCRPD